MACANPGAMFYRAHITADDNGYSNERIHHLGFRSIRVWGLDIYLSATGRHSSQRRYKPRRE